VGIPWKGLVKDMCLFMNRPILGVGLFWGVCTGQAFFRVLGGGYFRGVLGIGVLEGWVF
jgi:hypothetical protein